MRKASAFLESRVARRILCMFLVSAVLPALVLASLSLFQLRPRLEDLNNRRLDEVSCSILLSLIDRLEVLSTKLELQRNVLTNRNSSSSFTEPSLKGFDAVGIRDHSGRIETLAGPGMEPFGKESAVQRAHLEKGGVILLTEVTDQRSGRLLLGTRITDSSRTLWGEADLEQIFNGAIERDLIQEVGITLLDGSQKIIFTSMPEVDDFSSALHEKLNGPLASSFNWYRDEAEHRAVYRSYPLGSRFRSPYLGIAVSQPAAESFVPIDHLLRFLPFFLLGSLLFAISLGILEIKRSLEVFNELQEGTNRVGEAEFKTRVAIDSGDEFQKLADSFNRMTLKLSNQFSGLESMAQIHRSILAALDTGEIVEAVVRQIPPFFGIPKISLVLFEPDSSSDATVFYAEPEGGGETQRRTIKLDTDETCRLLRPYKSLIIQREQESTENLPLLSKVGIDEGLVIPISSDRQTLGVLALGFYNHSQITTNAQREAEQLAHLISIALSNARKLESLDHLNWTTLTTLARTVDAKTPWKVGHSERVTEVALLLGHRIGLSTSDLEIVKRGTLLHDIGEIAIPSRILNRTGPLSSDEWEIVKQHPAIGARILEPLKQFRNIIPIVLHHHERYDGHGYPAGLQGDEISLEVKIVTVAHVFEALYSERPHRPSMSLSEAVQTISKGAGSIFDPAVVRSFLSLIEEERESLVLIRNSFTAPSSINLTQIHVP